MCPPELAIDSTVVALDQPPCRSIHGRDLPDKRPKRDKANWIECRPVENKASEGLCHDRGR